MKVLLYYIGKSRDPHANGMAEEFIKRSTRFARCEMREVQPARFDPWAKHPTATKVMLDPAGERMDSAQFARLVAGAELAARDLIFLVGGASGLPAAWREKGGREKGGREKGGREKGGRDNAGQNGGMLLSISEMTMPHELARAVLAEQIYRAFTLLRGHPYPK
jgi:23S rRNA (pseudouridine1915-N3)-methyltransferase